jgi:hypothetical protein
VIAKITTRLIGTNSIASGLPKLLAAPSFMRGLKVVHEFLIECLMLKQQRGKRAQAFRLDAGVA